MRADMSGPYPLPPTHPFVGFDAWRLLEHQAAARPHSPFLIWHPFVGMKRQWNYAEFHRDCASVAAGLQSRGVRSGDRVLIHLNNCPEFLVAWFACAALGAVAVTTNCRSAPDELAYYVEDSAPVAAITEEAFRQTVEKAADSVRWVAYVTDHQPGTGRGGGEAFTDLYGAPETLEARPRDPGAPISVQYTSGTTSRPKGVVWTHANALWAARVNAAHEHLRADDLHLISMPLFHTNALAYSLLPTLWVGAAAVLTPKWSTSRFWDLSEAYGCTWASLMGLSQRAILTGEPPPAHSYRFFGTGVADSRFENVLGAQQVSWWGMTETVSHGILSNPWLPTPSGTIGRAAPEYEIRVVRADGTTPVEPGETGALLIRGIRGLSLFAEYLNNPVATASSFDEQGWFQTGDLITVHGDGIMSFADRGKDMLRVGSENVAASEIERVVATVPGVQEVAVVAEPDEKLDEVPVAFIIGDAHDAGLGARVFAACRERLADFKVPRRVEVVRVLPRSTISKVNKAELRRILATRARLDLAQDVWAEEAASDPSGDAD